MLYGIVGVKNYPPAQMYWVINNCRNQYNPVLYRYYTLYYLYLPGKNKQLIINQ